jgi:hypothetical protein
MTTVLADRAAMTVTGTPGTGTITLGAAVPDALNGDYMTFATAGVVDGNTVGYTIIDGHHFEVGHGVYIAAGTTLSRGPIFSSSGGAAISATSAAIVFVTALAEDLVIKPLPQTFTGVNGSAVTQNSVKIDYTTSDDGNVHGFIQIPSNMAGRGDVYHATATVLFNGVEDLIFALGAYNYNVVGGPILNTEPYLTINIETKYNDGAKNLIEFYGQFGSADGTQTVRPLSFSLNRDNNTLLESSMTTGSGNYVKWYQWSGGAVGNLATMGAIQYGYQYVGAKTGGSTTFEIQAAAGQSSFFNMGYNGNASYLQAYTSSQILNVQLKDGAAAYRVPLRLYSRYNAGAGNGTAMAVGLDSDAAGISTKASNDAQKGLVVQAFSPTQSANLFEAQASNGAVLDNIDPTGTMYLTAMNANAGIATSMHANLGGL